MGNRYIKSDPERVERLSDAEIDYPDIAELDESCLKKGTVAWPPAKEQLRFVVAPDFGEIQRKSLNRATTLD